MSSSNPKKSGKLYRCKYVEIPNLVPQLKVIEQLDDNEALKRVICNFYYKQSDPLSYVLELLRGIQLCVKKKSYKIILVTETLEAWCKDHNVSKFITQNQKDNALDVASMIINEDITKRICAIFHLYEDVDHVKHVISLRLSERKYKEAFCLMSAFNLEKEFSLKEFAFPAFFHDQEQLVKSYLQKCPNLQLAFVKTIDAHQDVQALQEFVSSLNIGGLEKNKPFYNPKWMKKRLPNYIEYFNIDISECPNIYKTRIGGAMHYLIRKRYTEESIEPEAFEELITNLVADHPSLQRELLIKLVCMNDSTAAFIIANALNLNRNNWPDCLKSIPPPSDEFITMYYRGVQLKSPSDFLPLRLKHSDIYFVDTPEKYLHAVQDISENYDAVGIDAEWRPNLGVQATELSLLQIAVWDSIYLFDIQTLRKVLKKTLWDHILIKIFYNREILKLGYGLANDLKELMKVLECAKENYSNCSGLVDLQIAFEKLKKNYPGVVNEPEIVDCSNEEETDSKGLSQLCKVVLGKPLNKGEQFSDWERRPLRQTQVVYAALDAYCLLMIYEKLYHILRDLNLSLDKLIIMPISSPKPNTKNLQPKTCMPLAVEDFKVVADCMLGGLGKYLRMFGSDVVCLSEGADPREALEIAQAEKRIILTCGGRYQKLKGYMPEDMCFCVDNKVDLKRQVAEIQKHFNLQLDESTLFSRCKICNGCNYLKVENEEMFTIWCNLVDDETKWIISSTKKKINTCYKCDVITADGDEHINVSIQLATLLPKVFETVKEFLICIGCGKVYWEGPHLSRLKDSISSVIKINPSKSFYKVLSSNPTNQFDCDTSGTSKECVATDVPYSNPACSNPNIISHFHADDSSEEDLDDIIFC